MYLGIDYVVFYLAYNKDNFRSGSLRTPLGMPIAPAEESPVDTLHYSPVHGHPGSATEEATASREDRDVPEKPSSQSFHPKGFSAELFTHIANYSQCTLPAGELSWNVSWCKRTF